MRIALVFLLAATLRLGADIPPAAQLLPADTVALFSVPDWEKGVAYWAQSPQGKLWNDPSFRPFREKLIQRFKDDFAGPFERQSGIRLADYAGLLRGQVTVAVTRNGWGGKPDARPGVLLLADTKDKEEGLKTQLTQLKEKWAAGGKPMRVERIRDLEFTTFILENGTLQESLDKVLPGNDDETDDAEADAKSSKRTELTVGRSGALLIAGNSVAEIEKVLARLSGGMAPALAEQAVFEANQSVFRDALAFAWIHFEKVFETFEKRMNQSPSGDDEESAESIMAPRTDKILAATGLSGLKTIAARLGGSPEGTAAELFLSVPEARRKGVFQIVAPQRKDAGPPTFVGADVVKFSRWRVDGQRAWSTIEGMLNAASPELSALLRMGFQAAGKDRDPNFDMKRSLVGNLGDDFILMEKNPRSDALKDLNGPPALFLIGSPDAGELVQGIRAATDLLPLAGGVPEVNQREFLGRKVYSLTLPAPAEPDEPGPSPDPRHFNFAASGGYAAMSGDVALLEEYLRSTETSVRPLRETAGLNEAAEKVGGMSTGYFGYENQAETVRTWLETAKEESATLDKLLSLAPVAGEKGMAEGEKKTMRAWFDVSALPPYEKVARYFHFIVYSLTVSNEGLSWKLFAPTPPN